MPDQSDGVPVEAPDVVLVGCVKMKRPEVTRAKDLYISALFKKGRAYAERTGARWFILSAQHGLVDPEEMLEPYDLQLSSTTKLYRRDWGIQVLEQLRFSVGSLAGISIEIHAGAAYADAIRQGLRDAGATIAEPLRGLTLGRRLQWYSTDPIDSISPAASQHQESTEGVSELVQHLSYGRDSITPSVFLHTNGAGLHSPGLYSWWVDSDGAATLTAGLDQVVEPGLIYAGLAGATRSRSGRKSTNTLWGRIKGMHLGSRHEFSTFRLSLGSILAHARGESEIDEAALTLWMHDHLRVIAIPVDDGDILNHLETAILAVLDPVLNLAKMQRTPVRNRLTELRREYGGKSR